MTEAQAFEIMSMLAIETNGWDDLSIEATVKRLEQLADAQAAARAVDHVINHHDHPGRPSWATIRHAYNSQLRHAAMNRPTGQIGTGTTVTAAEGRQIAAKAYARACAARADDDPRGQEPNPEHFDAILGIKQ